MPIYNLPHDHTVASETIILDPSALQDVRYLDKETRDGVQRLLRRISSAARQAMIHSISHNVISFIDKETQQGVITITAMIVFTGTLVDPVEED